MTCELWIMHGLPRGGKSTFCNEYKKDFSVLELDYFRKLITGKDYDEDNEPVVWDFVREIAIKLLNDGCNVIIDESNPSIMNLAYWVVIKHHVNVDLHISIINIESELNDCLNRSNNESLRNAIIRKYYNSASKESLEDYCFNNNIELINVKKESDGLSVNNNRTS